LKLSEEDQVVGSEKGEDVSIMGEKQCLRRVVMEERRVPREVIKCTHSTHRSCHTSYITEYTSYQEEECRESFVKDCFISFSKSLTKHFIDVCTETLVKNCSLQAEPVCSSEAVTSCATVQDFRTVQEVRPHCRLEEKSVPCSSSSLLSNCSVKVTRCELVSTNVTRLRPTTSCSRDQVEVCGPGACPLVKGQTQCRREKKAVIQQVPEEKCSLSVRPDCRTVTRLVPRLKPKEECKEVPQELCVRVTEGVEVEKRPVIKLWCFSPRFPRDGRLPPQGRAEMQEG